MKVDNSYEHLEGGLISKFKTSYSLKITHYGFFFYDFSSK